MWICLLLLLGTRKCMESLVSELRSAFIYWNQSFVLCPRWTSVHLLCYEGQNELSGSILSHAVINAFLFVHVDHVVCGLSEMSLSVG